MSDGTLIEWTDATWNIINGCSVSSPGCTNCYAMKLAGTRLKHVPSRTGLTVDSKAGPVWNGQTRFNEAILDQPLRWKRPRMIFVCAHGDLFHESVPDEWIDRVFAVMALAPQHTFQVLTKRAARMRDYMNSPETARRIAKVALDNDTLWGVRGRDTLKILGNRPGWDDPEYVIMPRPNIWLGVSVEDQTRADERIPDLLATPAAVRFLSMEPLLGPVDIRRWTPDCYECGMTCGLRLPGPPKIERCTECGEECGPDTEPVISDGCPKCGGELEFICPDCGHYMVYQHPDTPYIHWIIVGGESGHGARPMDNEWAQAIVDQCKGAGVPVFVKQLSSGGRKAIKDMEAFPKGLRVREMPKGGAA